jgi:hypothetical protein
MRRAPPPSLACGEIHLPRFAVEDLKRQDAPPLIHPLWGWLAKRGGARAAERLGGELSAKLTEGAYGSAIKLGARHMR